MTKEEVTQAKREKALAKARATRLRNRERQAELDRVNHLASMQAELAKIEVQIPQLSDDYGRLLEELSKGSGFDRKKWNRLDSLQNNIIGRITRRRRILEKLDVS